jgi:bifunctional ADP-heptose synthase (sugar kinase/adenylyltransferase)
LDTRSKIVGVDETNPRANGKPIRWVRGFFGPLLAEHARRLQQLRSPDSCLGVVIQDPARPLLPIQARAELVAALSAVDFVVFETNGLASEELDDLPFREQLSDHVRRRHSGNGAG